MSNTDHKLAVVMFGPQGSGKSTQVKRLAEHLGLIIYEAGAQLRERSKIDYVLHQQVSTGVLVSDQTMLDLTRDFLGNHTLAKGIVFDGYPRTIAQCQGFKQLIDHYTWRVLAIYISLADESAKKRLAGRFQLINGEKVYREDDKPEVVAKRLETFKSQTLPIKNWFEKNYKLLTIDGEPSVDEVTSAINLGTEAILNEK